MCMISLLMVYTLYYIESKFKQEFIQLIQIQTMKDDLNNLLLNLPDGIILYDDKNDKIVLVNKEFKHLFQCPNEGTTSFEE